MRDSGAGRTRNALVTIIELLDRSCADLNFTELRIFLAVAEEEGLSVSSLARICRLSDGTASRTIRRLVSPDTAGALAPARGLLSMARDPEDNRNRFIFLTGEGRALCEAINGIIGDSTRSRLRSTRASCLSGFD